ncbi:MAG: GGDEF domain-containing protein [Proteobacteria bacterium]|nr:MAG: GGDEF domain-containing protein [Pseudomonadota bacterium]PIE18572.1 MAG: GGDEF domain-containing protein [Pseudomonadota bacterium]
MPMDEWKTRITAIRPPEGKNRDACLVMIYPPGPLMGKRFGLERSQLYIGRGSDCAIQLDFDSVSRKHALVKRQGAALVITDLDSTNGTYVNEEPLRSRCALGNGDLVQIGNTIFKFLSGGNIESSYHEAIYRMTIVDGLTGAHNKRFLLDFLEREMARAHRYRRPMSLVIFDLDHFKKVNDVHGHLTGDHVLREVSRRISGRIRREELLARYGGEEFVVVLPEADHQGAMHFAEQLRRLVADEPIEFEGDTIPVTISLGVATTSGEEIDVSAFIRHADENLYAAKNGGRNRVVG